MKKKICISSVCAVVIFVLLIGAFWYYHPTHHKFNDRFVIGSTEEKSLTNTVFFQTPATTKRAK